jgi:exodeoxyribonuclease VII large subunit
MKTYLTEKDIPTVSAVIAPIKQQLERSFSDVVVKGEISNLTSSAAGHWYFTLSDQEASLQCAIFKQQAWSNPILRQLKNGDKVFCQGGMSVYPKKGSFQLIARHISSLGEGDLLAQFEKLKQKLAAEGLFDPQKKKRLPLWPQTIAIVTAEQGAALQDFLNVFFRRAERGEVIVAGALVQGMQAARSVMQALEKIKILSLSKKIDVVVIARGGGSFEDLFCFSDESLARYLAEYPLPTVSAIGHQVDFTLCDFVADFRAETPTAAAEVLSAEHFKVHERLANMKSRLQQVSQKILFQQKLKIQPLDPRRALEQLLLRLQSLRKRLQHFDHLKHPEKLLNFPQKRMFLDQLLQQMTEAMKKELLRKQQRLDLLQHMLKALGPSAVLERGFTYLECQGHLVASREEALQLLAKEGKLPLRVVWADGDLRGDFQVQDAPKV